MHMTTFQTTILGSSGAMPTSTRHTSTQLLQHSNKYYLLDCSEGAQMQLRRLNLPIMKINHIFITHMHGDHYLGLPGLLFTYHLLGRKKELHIYSPPGLEKIIKIQFDICNLELSFKINYHELYKGEEMIFEDAAITIETIKMLHSIPAFGFLFREKPAEPNIKKEYVEKYSLPAKKIREIKAGASYTTPEGMKLSNEELTIAPPLPRAYAFTSDTAYTESFIDQIKGANMLYHEATFKDKFAELAKEKLHATTKQAATVAVKSEVKKLLIGHYSARYDDSELDFYLDEAQAVFSNTLRAEEKKTYNIE